MLAPAAQLDSFLAKFEPDIAALARDCLAQMRDFAPGATELVYDAYNALSVSFAVGERLSDAFMNVAVYPRNVNVFFHHGADLEDPDGLLAGTGNRMRHVRVDDASLLKKPAMKRLMRQAMKLAGFRPGEAPGPVVIKKIYARQRARKPGKS